MKMGRTTMRMSTTMHMRITMHMRNIRTINHHQTQYQDHHQNLSKPLTIVQKNHQQESAFPKETHQAKKIKFVDSFL